jgi:hypothetical protein
MKYLVLGFMFFSVHTIATMGISDGSWSILSSTDPLTGCSIRDQLAVAQHKKAAEVLFMRITEYEKKKDILEKKYFVYEVTNLEKRLQDCIAKKRLPIRPNSTSVISKTGEIICANIATSIFNNQAELFAIRTDRPAIRKIVKNHGQLLVALNLNALAFLLKAPMVTIDDIVEPEQLPRSSLQLLEDIVANNPEPKRDFHKGNKILSLVFSHPLS